MKWYAFDVEYYRDGTWRFVETLHAKAPSKGIARDKARREYFERGYGGRTRHGKHRLRAGRAMP